MTRANNTPEIPEPLRDAVAGVLGEAVFRYVLSQEIARAVRYGDFFTLCVVGVNSPSADEPGLGRTFVRTVARVLCEELRVTDPVGVIPGAFGIILLNVADQPALGVADRIRSHVSELRMLPPGHGEPISISVGVACFPRDGHSEATLLTHASGCLAAARRRGGDRVVSDPAES